MGYVTLAHKVAEATAPSTGLLLANIAEGSLVKLNENGSPVEFYVACHNYEQDLNGAGRTLMVRKDCYHQRNWHGSTSVNYATCGIRSWLIGDYLALFDETLQAAIGTTEFRKTSTITMTDPVFLLSTAEYGFTPTAASNVGTELPTSDLILIAYFEGQKVGHWTRTVPKSSEVYRPYYISTSGAATQASSSTSKYYSRPCFTLPSTALFDEKTLLFKEVS